MKKTNDHAEPTKVEWKKTKKQQHKMKAIHRYTNHYTDCNYSSYMICNVLLQLFVLLYFSLNQREAQIIGELDLVRDIGSRWHVCMESLYYWFS